MYKQQKKHQLIQSLLEEKKHPVPWGSQSHPSHGILNEKVWQNRREDWATLPKTNIAPKNDGFQ